MSFPTAAYLQKATSRAKSDVANKLVSMFLHELSRKIATSLKLAVSDATYGEAVAAEFGTNCCYCLRPLEKDRAAVEHLDGMNRFRLGLHIPGNVIVACKRCNGEKRRDDQVSALTLAATGWESFLSHDSSHCAAICPSCSYWRSIWDDSGGRVEEMKRVREKLTSFRQRYPEFLDWGNSAKTYLGPILDTMYRDCQRFASARIKEAVEGSFSKLAILNESATSTLRKGAAG